LALALFVFSVTAAFAADDGSLERIQDAGKLTIGAEGNWIPYVYNEDGTGDLTGFEVDIAREIAKRLGVAAEFNISNKWDGVIAGLDAKRYDTVICGVNPTAERQEIYAMSIPYAENPFAVVVAADNKEINSFEDLKGKKCANSLSSTAGNIARKFGATLSDASLTQAMDLIVTGRTDASVNNLTALAEYMKERPDVKVRIAAIYEPENRYEIESSAMFRKADAQLAEKVDEIIGEMIADGTCYNLAKKYFGQEVADSVTIYKKN
jgi:cystine transport system substrate-binding protein